MIYVFAPSKRAARTWCLRNDVALDGAHLKLVAWAAGARGLSFGSGDRIVAVGLAPEVMDALLPALLPAMRCGRVDVQL